MISGPSGVGKGSVVQRLLGLEPEGLWRSVSYSTRDPRPGEQPGHDYVFVGDEQFEELVRGGAFLEWAEVFDHRYGTLAAPVERERGKGRDVILEIDVQGAEEIRRRVPDAVLVFLRPPSRGDLVERLRCRGTEDERELARRLARAEKELAEASWFDHVVENDELDRASAEVAAIITASRS